MDDRLDAPGNLALPAPKDQCGDNPFTAVGAVTSNAAGPDAVNAPAATSFDGSTGFPESDHTAVNTLAAWVRLDSATGPATAICEGTSEHQAFYLGYDRGNQGWMFQTTTTNDDSSDFPTAEGDAGTGALDTWPHPLVTMGLDGRPWTASTTCAMSYRRTRTPTPQITHRDPDQVRANSAQQQTIPPLAAGQR